MNLERVKGLNQKNKKGLLYFCVFDVLLIKICVSQFNNSTFFCNLICLIFVMTFLSEFYIFISIYDILSAKGIKFLSIFGDEGHLPVISHDQKKPFVLWNLKKII